VSVRRALAAAILCTAGCAAPGGPGAPGAPAQGPEAPAGAARGTTVSAVTRTRISPGQTGLEVVRWQVTDDGTRVDDALRANALQSVARIDEVALRANGLIAVPVAADGLEGLRAALGGSAMDVRTWLGTATTWHEMLAAPAESALIEVDGVARERTGARLRLIARAWPLAMEDGTRIAVNVVPQFVTAEREASLVRNGGRLAGEVVRSCALDLELERGVAWAITCDPRGWVETDAEAPARARQRESVAGPPTPGTDAPSGKIGARVSTLGTTLLLAAPERAGAPSRRTVLLLVPHLGGSPFPAEPAAEPMQEPSP
jgi:hypothetical protein